MKQHLRGHIQVQGGRPENVNATLEYDDPLFYRLRHLPVSSSSGTLTLDLSKALSFDCTLTENITTIDINGSFVTGEYWEFKLTLTQDSTARTVTWAAKFHFPAGTDHVMSTGSGQVDSIHGYTIDGGTTWYCTFVNNLA